MLHRDTSTLRRISPLSSLYTDHVSLSQQQQLSQNQYHIRKCTYEQENVLTNRNEYENVNRDPNSSSSSSSSSLLDLCSLHKQSHVDNKRTHDDLLSENHPTSSTSPPLAGFQQVTSLSKRKMEIIFSPTHAPCSTDYVITSEGIFGI